MTNLLFDGSVDAGVDDYQDGSGEENGSEVDGGQVCEIDDLHEVASLHRRLTLVPSQAWQQTWSKVNI